MRSSKIRALIRLVEESNIDELEVSGWGRKVCIRKKVGPAGGNHSPNPGPPVDRPQPAVEVSRIEVTAEKLQNKVTRTDLVEVKSPMVGTFYKAPAPDARPYVEVGQNVSRGQVVCVIEAMKLMNEIEAEISGRVIEILVENAKPVQFGQPLFLVEPAS